MDNRFPINPDIPRCFDEDCEGPCAGDVTGTLWCGVCGRPQPEDLEPEKTEWELKLDAAREFYKRAAEDQVN